MQYIITSNLTRPYLCGQVPMPAIRLADQTKRRAGHCRSANIFECEVTYAFTFDHVRHQLAFKQGVCKDGRLHQRVPAIQVMPWVSLRNTKSLRLRDGLLSRMALLDLTQHQGAGCIQQRAERLDADGLQAKLCEVENWQSIHDGRFEAELYIVLLCQCLQLSLRVSNGTLVRR